MKSTKLLNSNTKIIWLSRKRKKFSNVINNSGAFCIWNLYVNFFWKCAEFLAYSRMHHILQIWKTVQKLTNNSRMWRSIGKGVLNKTIDVKVQAQKCLNFDVNRFVKYSFSYGTSHLTLDWLLEDSITGELFLERAWQIWTHFALLLVMLTAISSKT